MCWYLGHPRFAGFTLTFQIAPNLSVTTIPPLIPPQFYLESLKVLSLVLFFSFSIIDKSVEPPSPHTPVLSSMPMISYSSAQFILWKTSTLPNLTFHLLFSSWICLIFCPQLVSKSWSSSYTPLSCLYLMSTVSPFRCQQSKLITLFKLKHNLLFVPNPPITPLVSSHTYCQRSSTSNNLHPLHANLSLFQNSFFPSSGTPSLLKLNPHSPSPNLSF